jgi:hypothetical protein
MDFSSRFARLITDPDEIRDTMQHGDHCEISRHAGCIYGLAPCAIYRGQPWFHQDATREKAEHMLEQCDFFEG